MCCAPSLSGASGNFVNKNSGLKAGVLVYSTSLLGMNS
jgi:hypothetical protein